MKLRLLLKFTILLSFSTIFVRCSSDNDDFNITYFGMPFDEELCSAEECLINKTWTSQEKCEYIKCNTDSCEGGGYLSWSEYVKCQYSMGTRVVIILFAIVYLFILFVIMSVVADDFFSPAISGIVTHLRMSESIAGVTFLAFGNGAPDVFGSISSILTTPSPKADLALGDLFGGGIFVTTVVLSAIILTKSFRIAIIPTIRDLLFFMVTLAFILMCFLKFDHIEVWMPATFLGIYAFYVLSVIILHILRRRRKQKKLEQAESMAVSRPGSSASSTSPIIFIDALKRKDRSIPVSAMFQFVLGYSHFIRNITRSAQRAGRPDNNETSQEASTSSYDNKGFSESGLDLSKNLDFEIGVAQSARGLKREETFETDIDTIDEDDSEIDYDDEGREAEFVISHGTVYPSQDAASIAASEIELIKVTTWKSWSWVWDLLNHLKPYPSLDEFREMNLFSKIVAVIKTVPVFFFKATIPTREMSWCKPLFILHCFASIQFALFAIQIINTKPFHGSPGLWLYGLGFSAILALLAMIFTPLTREQKYYKEAYSYLGFLMSIAWIYATSNEIVGVLTMIGVITGLSQELLGLTIMAWSNCIGDVVADIAVVKQGYPKMAMAAAIGGPLFNLLIGFGLPFTIAAAQGKEMELKINPVYRLLMLFLGISLVTTLVAIFVQRFRVRWPHAVVLIFIFIVFLIFICLAEFHVLEWN